jgi:hypothetical protein
MRMRAMMPVSTRTEADRGTLGNRVALLFPDLPVWPMAERDRLVLVREATRQVKSSTQARAASAVVQMGGWLPPALFREAARFGNAHVRLFNLVGSNIPGPQIPLYLDGMPLVAYYPLMPLAARVALSVAVITLVGVMGFGFTADWDAVPDLDRLALGLHDAFDELAKAAGV